MRLKIKKHALISLNKTKSTLNNKQTPMIGGGINPTEPPMATAGCEPTQVCTFITC
ncbi:hypothetical protein [Pseudoalteromonas umbrosa]|uniref:hypothetical protein n=1 Tax=Pseudoalteromonas umbrosa TaxID=3048489 RepID=UPI0024C243E1|nr:hypothetical protein [Pseudoalteromonas sp. B95]MDK1288127.1 hypothetical protein [Pseudoalteromonas sp. B95]